MYAEVTTKYYVTYLKRKNVWKFSLRSCKNLQESLGTTCFCRILLDFWHCGTFMNFSSFALGASQVSKKTSKLRVTQKNKTVSRYHTILSLRLYYYFWHGNHVWKILKSEFYLQKKMRISIKNNFCSFTNFCLVTLFDRISNTFDRDVTLLAVKKASKDTKYYLLGCFLLMFSKLPNFSQNCIFE